jgi:hypothetical protein
MISGSTLIPWCAIAVAASKIALTCICDNSGYAIPSLKNKCNISCLKVGTRLASEKERKTTYNWLLSRLTLKENIRGIWKAL